MTTRRDLLTWLAGAAAGAVLPAPLRGLAAADAPLTPGRAPRTLGVQLYTLRSLMQRDVADTLSQVAAAGYREVETAGYHGVAPEALRRLLEARGLTAPSAHVGMPELTDRLDETLAAAREVGHRWLVLPWVDRRQYPDRRAWEGLATTLNRIGERTAQAGIRLAFHNNETEAVPLAGTRPLDILLEHTDRDLVDFELDVFWLVKGGGSPRDYCVDWPGRFMGAHLKDTGGAPAHAMRDVGAGIIDWRLVLDFLARRARY